MSTNPPTSFEEKLTWRDAVPVYVGLVVLVVVASLMLISPNEQKDFAELAFVISVMLFLFATATFREWNATIRVEDDVLVLEDKNGMRRIPFTSIQNVYRAKFFISGRGGYARAWGHDLQTKQQIVNVLYSHIATNVLLKECVALDLGMDKLQAIPTRRPDELYAAIKSHLSA